MTRRPRIVTTDAFIEPSLSDCLLHTVWNRYDNVDLADLGLFRLHIANDCAVPALDDRARVQSLYFEQGVIEVLETAVDELRCVRPALHDDALRQEVIKRGRRRCTRDSRNRIRDDGLIALP